MREKRDYSVKLKAANDNGFYRKRSYSRWNSGSGGQISIMKYDETIHKMEMINFMAFKFAWLHFQ